MSLSTIWETSDEEFIELAAYALYLDEREYERLKLAVNQGVGIAFGGKESER